MPAALQTLPASVQFQDVDAPANAVITQRWRGMALNNAGNILCSTAVDGLTVVGGLPMSSNGVLFYATTGAITHHMAGGTPCVASGALRVSTSASDYVDQGVKFTDGAVSVSFYQAGSDFNDDFDDDFGG